MTHLLVFFGAILISMTSLEAAIPFLFKAEADTSLVEELPESNFGADGQLYVGTVADNKNAVILLRFDLSGLPATGSVVYATLTLRVRGSAGGGSYEVYRVLKSWGEGTKAGLPAETGAATWLSPRSSLALWSGPGGAAGADYSAALRLSSAARVGVPQDLLFFVGNPNLLADLEEWRRNPQTNHGLMMRRNLCCGQSTTRVKLFSSEYPEFAPELKVYLGDPNAPVVSLNGDLVPDEGLDFGKTIAIRVDSPFPNGQVYYTLDGSQPSVNSARSTGIILIDRSSVLRALTYSADFSQSGEIEPIVFRQHPTFTVITRTSGGGSTYVFGTPAPPSIFFSGPEYFSNTVVRVFAKPGGPGSSFLRWESDDVADPTAADTTVLVDENEDLMAVFESELRTTVVGQGSLHLDPPGGIYEVGKIVTVTPVPAPGYYFAQWGGAAAGNAAPLSLSLIQPTTLSSLFLPLAPNEATLNVRIEGGGFVQFEPRNVYNTGQTVELNALPLQGFTFVGWEGDASGVANPLQFLVGSGSQTIVARFTGSLPLQVQENANSLTLSFTPENSFIYRLEQSANLATWTEVERITNAAGTVTRTFGTTNKQAFYRLEVQPR